MESRFRSEQYTWDLTLLLDGVGYAQHLLGSGAHPEVLSEIHPAHRSAGVHQNFSWARNGPLARALRMYQVVAADGLSLRVRQERIGITLLAAMIARNLWQVDANRHRPDAPRRKIVEMLFDTP